MTKLTESCLSRHEASLSEILEGKFGHFAIIAEREKFAPQAQVDFGRSGCVEPGGCNR